MNLTSYTHVFRLPVKPAIAFDLLSNPLYLDALTPTWFRLQILSPLPEPLGSGSEVSYLLRWRGVPMRWTSRLTDWHSPHSFSYEQKVGPYRFFRHDHSFTEVEGGTEIRDHALFSAPGGALLNRYLALPDLRRIFAHRERCALGVLNALQAEASDSGRDAKRMPLTRASSSLIERPT